MTVSIRSGATDGALQVNGVDAVVFNASGIVTGAGKQVVQIVTARTGITASGTTILPVDNTIPQNTEGVQFLTASITPTNINSLLEIDVNCILSHSANSGISTALFQDANANALAAVVESNAVATAVVTQTLKFYMTAGTISATTFNIRCGGTAVGTIYLNGASATQYFGGVGYSSIVIKEYLP